MSLLFIACTFYIHYFIFSLHSKTEATKQCLDYLTKVSTGSSAKASADAGDDEAISDIAHRIIAASPILEAFGNAQTVRNPNSSRFGKWMELSFDKHNEIKGSRIISYLLEVNRVLTLQLVVLFCIHARSNI
jgi:myosin heavy subunit